MMKGVPREKNRIKLTPTVKRQLESKKATLNGVPKNNVKKDYQEQESTVVGTSSTEELASSSEDEAEILRRVTDCSDDDSSFNYISEDFNSSFKTPVTKRSKLSSIDNKSLQRPPRKSKKFSSDRQEKLTPKNLLAFSDMNGDQLSDSSSGRDGPLASTPVDNHPVTALNFGLSDITDSDDYILDEVETAELVNPVNRCPPCVIGRLKFNPLPSFFSIPKAHKKFLNRTNI